MSWAEVKKINSDFTEPLNYLAYIQDLAMFGKKGYVYKSEDMLTQLSTSKNATTHQIAKTLLLQGIIDNGFDVGKYFAKIIPSSDPVFDSLPTIDDVVDDETAMTAVANSETAMTAVANSETACDIIRSSPTAIQVFDDSSPITVPIMTSYTTPSGTVRESSSAQTGPGWTAFNQATNDTFWSSNNEIANAWIEYEFPDPVWIYKATYHIRTVGNVNQYGFNSCKLQYFDGDMWVDSFATTFDQTQITQERIVAKATGKRKQWRWLVLSNHGGAQYAQARNLQFYGK